MSRLTSQQSLDGMVRIQQLMSVIGDQCAVLSMTIARLQDALVQFAEHSGVEGVE